LHSYFTSGFIRTWRRSTTMSFEAEGERLPPLMDAKKGKTRKESTPIKVWVTPEEKAAIAAKADAHRLGAGRESALFCPLCFPGSKACS
jgi:hypothetical protein